MTTSERNKRLEELREKKRQLNAKYDAQIQALKAAEAAKERKADTRRKILYGSFVQHCMKADGYGAGVLQIGSHTLDAYIKDERDRQLLGLPTRPDQPQAVE